MNALWRREWAPYVSSRRGLYGFVAFVLVMAFAILAAAHASADMAAFWALVVPAFLGFAHSCALTTRDRDSGLAARMFTTPVRGADVLVVRWLGGTIVGLAGVGFGVLVLLPLHQLGLVWSEGELALLALSPVLAAAASALGLVAGLLVGSSASLIGTAVAAGGTMILPFLPGLTRFLAGRFPSGAVAGSAAKLLAGLSPASWITAYAKGAGVMMVWGLLAYLAVCLLGAWVIHRMQTPLGRTRGSVRLRPVVVTLVAMLVLSGIFLEFPRPPSQPFGLVRSGPSVMFAAVESAAEPEAVDGPPDLAIGQETELRLILFLPPGEPAPARIHIRLTPLEIAPHSIATLSPAEFDERSARPSTHGTAEWPLRARGEAIRTLTPFPSQFLAEIEVDGVSSQMVIGGPWVSKATNSAEEVAIVFAVALSVIAPLAFVVLRRERLLRLVEDSLATG